MQLSDASRAMHRQLGLVAKDSYRPHMFVMSVCNRSLDSMVMPERHAITPRNTFEQPSASSMVRM
jgi:hypothetical protein